MRTLRALVLTATLHVPSGIVAQSMTTVTVHMRPDSLAQYYPWMTTFAAGPVNWRLTPRDSTMGVRYRAAVLTSEIYSTLIIERIHLGREGCCARLEWAKRVDLEPMRRQFALGPAIVGLAIEWADSTTLLLALRQSRFAARVVSDSTLRVEHR